MHSSPLVLRNARVLDVTSGNYRETDVTIRDGRFESIGSVATLPEGAAERDLTGACLLPGLIDCHVHVTAHNADLGSLESMPQSYVTAYAMKNMNDMLRRGFTSVRDASGADFGLEQARDEGYFTGTRLFYCGKALSQTGGHGDFRSAGEDHSHTAANCCAGIGRVADGISAVREAARDELRKGAHHIKIMASGGIASPTDRIDSTQYSVEEIRAVVEEATAANRYVAAHAYTPRAVNRCLELGVRTIEHGNYIDEESIRLFLERDAFWVATLTTHWALVAEGAQFGLPEASRVKAEPVFAAGMEALERASQAGVKIPYATDLLGGMQRLQNREFEIRSRVQSNLEVVQSATTIAAELLQREGELGQVVEGAIADAIIVDGDPLEDIEVLASFEEHRLGVIQNGAFVA